MGEGTNDIVTKMYMKDCLKEVRLTVMEYINGRAERYTMVTG
jgi:hypothetical protein